MGYGVLIAAVIFFLSFAYSYWVVEKINGRIWHFVPLYVAIIPIVFAIKTMFEPPGYFDFRALIAAVLLIIALLLVIGWVMGRVLNRRKTKRPKIK